MKQRYFMVLALGLINVIGLVQAQNPEAAISEPQEMPLNTSAAKQEIELAYKKEVALLTSQVRNLKQRVEKFNSTSAEDKSVLEDVINRLEVSLLEAEHQSRMLTDESFELQRNQQSVEENQQLLDATLAQAKSSLSAYDLKLDPEAEYSPLEALHGWVNLAVKTLHNQSQVTTEPGRYFVTDGTAVDGQIMRIGQIASYGYSDLGSGALAPAGEGEFKVWQNQDDAAVEALFNNQFNGVVPIFLYESSLNAIEEKQDKTILSVIQSGGVIAWIIVALGLVALLLIVLRFGFLKQASASTEKMLNSVVKEIEQNDLQAAIEVANQKSSSSARVLLSALRNIKRDREHVEDIVSESILHESAQLNRFGSMILVIATVTPLLGLLGTVTGMISTFDIITEFGTGDPKLLSSGISIALVTTEVGLAVAIPALLFGNLLSGWSERIKDDMEKAALRAINVYQKTVS